MTPRKPDLLCIGAQKAGTSWLFSLLKNHHQIWAPPLKELHYFNTLYTPSDRNWTTWRIKGGVGNARRLYERRKIFGDPEYEAYLDAIDSEEKFSESWYLSIFASAPDDEIAIDFTPAYSTISKEGVEHVRDFLPEARFIYIIRDPLDRALSEFRMWLGLQNLDISSDAEWRQAFARMDFGKKADYEQYVPRWENAMGDRILFLPFGKIVDDPSGFMSSVEKFLEIDSFDYSFDLAKKNETNRERFDVPDELVDRIAELMMPQSMFLEEFFGSAFMAECRIQSIAA